MKRKNLFNALLIAGLLVATPLVADAAGLGKLKVVSALGQPLRAEIDLIAVPKDEVDLITARVATPDAYKQHNIEWQEGSANIRFAVEKRPNGEPYLKITSTQAFNEPFLDLLIQLDWPSGRLLREYTILLDPPGFQDKPAAPVVRAPVAQFEPAVKPAPIAEKPAPLASPEPIKAEKKSVNAAKHKKQAKGKKAQAILKAEPASPPRQLTPAEQTFPRFESDQPSSQTGVPQAQPSAIAPVAVAAVKPASQEYKVKKGDSLSKIAREMKPEGYSLDQMMVALYERNKHAFDGNNMNRIKTGQILRVPENSDLDATSQSAAVKEIKVQAADWNVYRQKLAGAVAEQQAAKEETKPEATGKITAKAEDKGAKPQQPGQDVLKLSRGETTGKGKGASGKGGGADVKALQDKLIAAQDDAVAKEKALKEANSRIGELDKNVKEMRALLDLQNKQMAELAKQAKAKPVVVPPPVAKVEPAPAKPEVKPEPVKQAATAAPTPEKLEPLVKAVPDQLKPQPKPEQKKPVPVPTVKAPEPETSFIDTVLSNPLYLGGGAAAVVGALFAALWALGRRRKKSLASFEDSIMTNGGGSDLKINTVFGNTAGGQIDTGDTSFLTDFSQAGMGAIDTNDVDPIAEAEVYMAYGRDAQAEEILKEAMSKDPNRHEIQLKLLEIYAGRKNTAAFETLAAELYAATSGQGTAWEKAAELGRSLDAGNPLYAVPEGKGNGMDMPAMAAVGSAAITAAVAPDLDFNLDIDTQGEAVHAKADSHAQAKEPAGLGDALNLDLDTVAGAVPKASSADTHMTALDFNLDTIIPQAVEKHAEAPTGTLNLGEDILFDIPELSAASSTTAVKGKKEEDTLDFDFNLDHTAHAVPAPTQQSVEEPMMPELDLSGIDLDLGKTAPQMGHFGGQPLEDATTLAGGSTVWEEASTKLDLARAYLEMGDKEGAREILQEVLAEGGPEQQENAKKLLATLS